MNKIPYLQKLLNLSGMQVITTTHQREWWGWFGAINWLIFMMYSLTLFIIPSLRNGEIQVENHNLYFMLIFALSILVFSLFFGKNLTGLSNIAFYTAPAAIFITAIFPLVPPAIGVSLYMLSPICMAPVLVRRVFGVLYTAPASKRLTSYMSAIAVSYLCYSIWLVIEPPKKIALLIPALLAIPAWFGIRHTIKPFDISERKTTKFSWKFLIGLMIILPLLLWIATMNAFIFSNILSAGIETSNTVISLLSFGLPGLCYLLYAIVSDSGRERTGFIISMMIFIFGTFIGLLAGNLAGLWSIPLTIAISIGGSYFEFLFFSLPVFFFASAKRPLFVSSLGVVSELIFGALLWKAALWVPSLFWTLGAPLFYSAALSTVVFVILLSLLFEYYREKSLAAVLHKLLYETQNKKMEKLSSPKVENTTKQQSLMAFELTQQEIEVALLIVEGKTRSEIMRKLRLKSADTTNLFDSIRDKISGEQADPIITTVVKQYDLTRRETEMLSYLQKGMTNQQIAAELFIAESTVKNHVYSLINKLPIKKRQELVPWLETIKKNLS